MKLWREEEMCITKLEEFFDLDVQMFLLWEKEETDEDTWQYIFDVLDDDEKVNFFSDIEVEMFGS